MTVSENSGTPPTHLAAYIQAVADFPSEGILFRDITPLLASPEAFHQAVDWMAEVAKAACHPQSVDVVVGIESRGFIFGTPVALALGASFVPARKPGKLPRAVRRLEYSLEYGTDALEVHTDAIKPGDRVVVVDDLVATGGTARATGELIQGLGGTWAATVALIELPALAGRKLLQEQAPLHSLLQYP